MKILYAADNRIGSKFQLSRFLSFNNSNHIIKIAAYQKSSPKDISIDWTLDALLDIFDKRAQIKNNIMLQTYCDQVKAYAPDLIISDLEIFTSHIAQTLGIPIWQVSPILLYKAQSFVNKSLSKIMQYYSSVVKFSDEINHIIEVADRRLIYSHLCDIENPPEISNKFEWIRPHFEIGSLAATCQHDLVAVLPNSNKKIISYLKNNKDSVVFSEKANEKYSNIIIKDIANTTEYTCNLKNCNIAVNEGYEDFIADAFYSEKPCLIFPNLKEKDCIFNSAYSNLYKTSKTIYDGNLIKNIKQEKININKEVKFLNEEL